MPLDTVDIETMAVLKDGWPVEAAFQDLIRSLARHQMSSAR